MARIFKSDFSIIRLILRCESMFGQINAMSISCETAVDFCKLCLMWTKGWPSLQKCQVIRMTCLKDEVAYLFGCKLLDVIQCCKLSRGGWRVGFEGQEPQYVVGGLVVFEVLCKHWGLFPPHQGGRVIQLPGCQEQSLWN